MRKNPTYTALLGPTRLLISEKYATYTINWSYTIIWQVRVLNSLLNLKKRKIVPFSDTNLQEGPNLFLGRQGMSLCASSTELHFNWPSITACPHRFSGLPAAMNIMA